MPDTRPYPHNGGPSQGAPKTSSPIRAAEASSTESGGGMGGIKCSQVASEQHEKPEQEETWSRRGGRGAASTRLATGEWEGARAAATPQIGRCHRPPPKASSGARTTIGNQRKTIGKP